MKHRGGDVTTPLLDSKSSFFPPCPREVNQKNNEGLRGIVFPRGMFFLPAPEPYLNREDEPDLEGTREGKLSEF